MAPSSSAARRAAGWLLAGLLLPLAAQAQSQPQPIGDVITSQGTVTVDAPSGTARLAGPDEPLYLGEIVRAQAGSRAELRLRDGTRMQVAANSAIHLSEFVLKPEQPAEERLSTRLLKGAMRVLTGAIAQRRPGNALFTTPTATLGIRGTDFVMRVCDDDCRLSEDATVARAGGEFVGRLGGSAGGVSAIDARGRWRVLPLSAPLREGDRVLTGATGIALLVLRDGTRVTLDPGSRLWLREVRFDEAAPRQGRIRMELQRGAAQVSSGQLARLRSERFVFEAGGQVLRAHGTAWGAVVEVVTQTADQAADAARDAGQRATGAAGEAAATAIRNAAAPVLEAMSVQLDAWTRTPPRTPDEVRAVQEAVQALSDRLQQAAGAAMAAQGPQDTQVRETVAALNVLRWRFLAQVSVVLDASGTAATMGVAIPTGAFLLGIVAADVGVVRTQAEPEATAWRAAYASVGLHAGDLAAVEQMTRQPHFFMGLPLGDYLADRTDPYFDAQGQAAQQRLRATLDAAGQALAERAQAATGGGQTGGGQTGGGQRQLASPAGGERAAPTPGQSLAGAGGPATRLANLAVTEGAVSVRGDGGVLRVEAGQRIAVRGKGFVPSESVPAFQAPDPRGVSVDPGRFFGPDLGQVAQSGQAGQAPAGTYVHVHDGAVALAQGGEEVVLTQGETALAPADGGAPRKVRNGVRVASSGALGLPATIAGPICRPEDPPPGPVAGFGWRPTLAVADVQGAAFQGEIDGKLTEQDVAGRTGGSGTLGGNRFGANFAPSGREGLAGEAKGSGLSGAGRLQATENVVTGRHSDTFAGNRINNAGGGDVTLGGRPGRVGNTDRGGQVASGMSVYAGSGGVGFAQPMTTSEVAEGLQAAGGTVTGQGFTDAAELAYAQSVGSDGYQATKDMTNSERIAYWTAEQNSQMTGGKPMTPEQAAAERDSQARGAGGRPREDDNPSAGGSGVPIYLGAGAFGNEIRGVERAVNARIGRAGGAGDGRGDQQAAGGTGGMAMQRGAQLGAPTGPGPTGTLNLDAALSINRLVNPGSQ